MKQRLNPYMVAPKRMESLNAFGKDVLDCGLESSLVDLVKIRGSQINGCAFCLNMHTAEARERGETEQRLHLLNTWRESPLYTDRERAALAWTESLTNIAQTHAPDEVYREVEAHFTPEEQVALTMVVIAINAYNRLAIGFKYVHPVPAAV